MANSDLASAAQLVANAELNALKAILAAAQEFTDTLQSINDGLPFPAGYTSEAKVSAAGLISTLSFQLNSNLPQAIQRLSPPAA